MSNLHPRDDIQLCLPNGREVDSATVELDEDTIRHVYEDGPQHLDAADKHAALQLSNDFMEVSISGEY